MVGRGTLGGGGAHRVPFVRGGPAAGDMSWFAHSKGMARSLGALFTLGPLCALIQLLFSTNHYRYPLLFGVACGVWAAVGLALLTGAFDRRPGTFFKTVLFVSTAVVSVAVYAAGAPGAGMFFYYLWVTPYAFVFYSRGQAAAQVVFVGFCSAAVEVAQVQQHPGLGSYAAHVPLILGVVTSLVVIGTLARRLTGNVLEADARFGQGFDSSPLGLAFVSLDGIWLDVNDALCGIVGRPRRDLVGGPVAAVFDADDPVELGLAQATVSQPHESVTTLRRPDGDEAWVAATVVPVTPMRGDGYLYLQISDITEKRRDRDALVYQALHDPLTGLFNRVVFMDRVASALQRREQDGTGIAVVLADIDQFKVLNDSLGHHVGDEVLVTIAPRLAAALAPGDVLARLGGDEFVVLCEAINGPMDALDRASRLARVLAEPVELPSGSHVVSASIGVTLAEGSATVTGMLADADAAMYRAKALGRGRIEMFDTALRTQADERLRLERDMRAALGAGQFCLEYQPIVDTATGRTVAVEALIRWDHPTRGRLQPDSFISLAEESGLICEIGEWVLRTACDQLAQWQTVLPLEDRPFGAAVNVSARQLAQPGFVDLVADVFRSSGVAWGSVGLEITESVLATAEEQPGAKLTVLKALGAQLVLDDFGTGYSSLSYLKRFPVDLLKIDRSFVSGLGTPEGTAIVEAVVRLATALRLEVVAEGVEADTQLQLLRTMGCHQFQGFLASQALPAGEVLRWLLEQQSVSGAVALDLREASAVTAARSCSQPSTQVDEVLLSAGLVHKYRRVTHPSAGAGSLSNGGGPVSNGSGHVSNGAGPVSNGAGPVSNRAGPVSNRAGPVSNGERRAVRKYRRAGSLTSGSPSEG